MMAVFLLDMLLVLIFNAANKKNKEECNTTADNDINNLQGLFFSLEFVVVLHISNNARSILNNKLIFKHLFFYMQVKNLCSFSFFGLIEGTDAFIENLSLLP